MKSRLVLAVATLLLFMPSAPCTAAVDWEIQQTLKTGDAPLGVAVSAGTGRVYVLTQKREILIYSLNGTLSDRIPVGETIDGIHVGPRDDLLILTSKKDATVQIVALDFIQEINVEGSPAKGPQAAPVVIAVFSDFQCPYCGKLMPLIEQVMEKYPKEVKVVFKHFPLRNHGFAYQAAVASMAAHRQGKFWEYHDLLFKNSGQLSDGKLREIAAAVNLDADRFEKDMKDPQIPASISRDLSDGGKAGVRGTPTIFVNGRIVRNRSLAGFQALVEKALKP